MLLYKAEVSIRVAFLVSKKIGLEDWKYIEKHSDITTLTLRTACGPITIINIYYLRLIIPRNLILFYLSIIEREI